MNLEELGQELSKIDLVSEVEKFTPAVRKITRFSVKVAFVVSVVCMTWISIAVVWPSMTGLPFFFRLAFTSGLWVMGTGFSGAVLTTWISKILYHFVKDDVKETKQD